MSLINIRRDNPDPFYRYKMDRLIAKIEGKGNGIKTVVVNLSTVADQLARPPSYVIKYFGFELGAQTNIDPKDDRWIINGAHEASKLQDHLDGFITKFVICSECKNPETVISLKEGDIKMDCKACGARSTADPRHKLSPFILKNAPKKGKKDKSTKKADRRARKEAERNGDHVNGNGHSPGDSGSDHGDENGDAAGDDDGSDDDALTRKIKAEVQEMEETVPEEKEWSVDMSEEAIKARAQALPDDLKNTLVIEGDDEDGEKGGNTAYDALGKWIEEQAAEKGDLSKVDNVEIYLKAKELGIESKHRTATVLAQCIFDDGIVKQIDSRASLLKKSITSERHEKAFLGGLERFVGIDKPKLSALLSAILLKVYENDLVSEDTLKAWGTKASKKYVDLPTSRKVRKNAEKFLEWLENADSGSDDSDSE